MLKELTLNGFLCSMTGFLGFSHMSLNGVGRSLDQTDQSGSRVPNRERYTIGGNWTFLDGLGVRGRY